MSLEQRVFCTEAGDVWYIDKSTCSSKRKALLAVAEFVEVMPWATVLWRIRMKPYVTIIQMRYCDRHDSDNCSCFEGEHVHESSSGSEFWRIDTTKVDELGR